MKFKASSGEYFLFFVKWFKSPEHTASLPHYSSVLRLSLAAHVYENTLQPRNKAVLIHFLQWSQFKPNKHWMCESNMKWQSELSFHSDPLALCSLRFVDGTVACCFTSQGDPVSVTFWLSIIVMLPKVVLSLLALWKHLQDKSIPNSLCSYLSCVWLSVELHVTPEIPVILTRSALLDVSDPSGCPTSAWSLVHLKPSHSCMCETAPRG